MKHLLPEEIEAVIINNLFEGPQEHGFRAVTVKSISVKNGRGENIHLPPRPNKGAIVMEAFLFRIGPESNFLESPAMWNDLGESNSSICTCIHGPTQAAD